LEVVVAELLLAVVEAVEEPIPCDAERFAVVLGRMREGVDKEGRVVDLVRDVGVWSEVVL
jgi:hypothetical protein